MATLSQPFGQDDEQQLLNQAGGQQNPQTTPTQNGVQPIGAPGGAGGTITPQGSPSTPAGTNSGTFTNIQKYLNANPNQNLGGDMASNINSQASQANQNISNAFNQFNQASQAAVQPIQQYAGLASQAVADPTAFLQNSQNVNNLTQARDAQYTGPKDLSGNQGNYNYQNILAQANNANQQAQQAQTESGRFDLLQQMYNKPSYTQGQQSLDNLFLQASPSQFGQLSATRQNTQGALSNLSNTQNKAIAVGQQAANQVGDINSQVRNTLNQGVANQSASIQNEMSAATAAQQAATDTFLSNAKQGIFDQASYDALVKGGIKPGGMVLANAGTYAANPTPATIQQAATADDYARLKALGQLIGGTATGGTSAILSQFSDPTQAGAYSKAPVLDMTNYLQAVKSAQDAYNQNETVQHGLSAIGQTQEALGGGMYTPGGLNSAVSGEASLLRQVLPTMSQYNASPTLSADLKNLTDTELLDKYKGADLMSLASQQLNPNEIATYMNIPGNAQYGGGNLSLAQQGVDITKLPGYSDAIAKAYANKYGTNLYQGGVREIAPELGKDPSQNYGTGSAIGDLLAQYNFENQKAAYWNKANADVEKQLGLVGLQAPPAPAASTT